ncbi:CotO family spore coat protein [Halobacillus sp. Marseille-Q1614]|uniref:CotO family spore coat protein n=1 Tax=Halobacillus sp. Marseille-Q1614 TaxID=2709134 RepID=UPI0020C4AEEA|nr:CotO family spore coat protein [Halobacillus sp. Marseille-Q1614]
MANKKQIAKPPMLYITQPNLPPAEVSMQTSFRTAPARNTSLQEKELRLRNQLKLKEEEETAQKEESPAQSNNESPKAALTKDFTRSNREERRDRRQKFRDMSLEEKVHYFVELPSQVPKMKCQVTAFEANDTFKGYINMYEDGVVHMKTFQKPFQQEIPFEEIRDIRLIGF